MIIQRANVSLASAYSHQIERSRTEQLRMWDNRTQRQQDDQSPAQTRPTPHASPVAVVHAAAPSVVSPGIAPVSGPTAQSEDTKGARIAAGVRFTVLIALVERLTGRKVQVLDPAEVEGSGQQPPVDTGQVTAASPSGQGGSGPVGWGIDYQLTETRVEAEHVTFAATGRVTTADGREIAFDIGLDMSRESVEVSNFRFRAGDAMKDPLVLNFGGTPVALSNEQIDFDLDADGTAERISFVANGNGFLVLDRDGDGAVDDGRELFGPLRGDGFGELAAYDQDGNGWIDEADPVYSRLRIWSSPAGQLSTLAERGVGAISLARVATPFQLDAAGDAAGEAAGVLRETGFWLGENGSGGTVHHIDLAV